MKKSFLLGCLALFSLSHPVRAVWAKHEVVTPENVKPYRDQAPAIERLANGTIRITAPVSASKHKGFYLFVCKERLPGDQLELRRELSSWKRFVELQEQLTKVENAKPLQGLFDYMDKIESIRPLPAGEVVILDAKEALRAYVVWDHGIIFEKGAMIMDGGLWLTYDVPAFVEALPAPPVTPAPETP